MIAVTDDHRYLCIRRDVWIEQTDLIDETLFFLKMNDRAIVEREFHLDGFR